MQSKGGKVIQAGTKASLEKLNKLLRETDIEFKIRNQDGTVSKIKLQRTGWNLKRKTYFKNRQSLLDANYELIFNLERKS